MKNLIITTALCTLFNTNLALHANYDAETEHDENIAMTKIQEKKENNSSNRNILVSLDSNFGYRKHNLQPNLYNDAKYKIANTFGLGGHQSFIFNDGINNDKNYLETGIVIDIKYGPGLRGNDEKQTLNKEIPGKGFEGFEGFAGISTSGSAINSGTVNGWKIKDDDISLVGNSAASGTLGQPGSATAVTGTQGEATLPQLKVDKDDLGGLGIKNSATGGYVNGSTGATIKANQLLLSGQDDLQLKGTAGLANTDQIKLQIQDETGGTGKSQIVIPQNSLTLNVPSLDVTGKTATSSTSSSKQDLNVKLTGPLTVVGDAPGGAIADGKVQLGGSDTAASTVIGTVSHPTLSSSSTDVTLKGPLTVGGAGAGASVQITVTPSPAADTTASTVIGTVSHPTLSSPSTDVTLKGPLKVVGDAPGGAITGGKVQLGGSDTAADTVIGKVELAANSIVIPALDLATTGGTGTKVQTIPYNANSATPGTEGERLKLPHENKNIDIERQNFFIPKSDLKVDIPNTVADISNLQTTAPTSNLAVGIADATNPDTDKPTPLDGTQKIPVTGLTLVQDSSVTQQVNGLSIPAVNVPEIPAIPAVEADKKDLSTFDLGLSQAFFYLRKGEKQNPYIFEFGKTSDVTETFNIGFADIMPGADDFRFTVHANINTEMISSAPGWQVGETADFAKLTGRIKGIKREPLWFKKYAALYNESNYRYAPRVNFISPELMGFRFAASFTPDGGDGATMQPFSTNRINKGLTQQGIFAGNYENIWSGAANYTYEGQKYTTSLSLVGEYAEHEQTCITAGKCTQNYYDLKTYAISGMVSWDNFAVFGAWGDMGRSGHRRNLGQLTDGSNSSTDHYSSKETPITTEGTLKTYNNKGNVVAVGTEETVGGTIQVNGYASPANNDRVASDTLDVSYDNAHENKGSVVAPQGGYAVIERKKHETNYWTVGASYKIDNASFGASYFHSNAGQYDVYGGTGELDRFTIITTYKIAQGMTPYFEVTWFKTKDESTTIGENLIDSVELVGGKSGIEAADYNKLNNLSDGKDASATGVSAATAPGSKKVRYVNQIGLFKEPLKGNKGVVMMAGIKFRF